MHNIVTVYRFNTPFLDIKAERDSLVKVKDKIKYFLQNESHITLSESSKRSWDYHHLWLTSDLIEVRFAYISQFHGNYYMPIFTMDVYVKNVFLIDEESRTRMTLFLTSFFECFDGLNEKEYLIDIDKNIYYQKWFLKTRCYPHHDFSDLEVIWKIFESKNWEKIIQEFILKFQDKKFILNTQTAPIYHKIHSIVLYYIYLVFIMYTSILNSKKQLKHLDEIDTLEDEFSAHIDLINKRLKYVNDISQVNFRRYYEKLEVFFTLFK